MSQVLHAFEIGLYREHLEEISFLYEQRLAMREDAELAWTTLADADARIEAHLDALVVGDTLALQVCRDRTSEADFGELYAITSVYCRQKQAPLLATVLRRLDASDATQVNAVADALKYELPPEWTPFIEQALIRGDHRQTGLMARVVGYRRLPLAAPLLHIARTPGHDMVSVLAALGQLREPAAEPLLLSRVTDSDQALRSAALRALLAVAPHALPAPLSPALLPLAGDARVAQTAATTKNPSPEFLLALGLTGELSCLRLLYDQLQQPELAESAALALHWITGAPLRTPVFVPDPVQEDELVGAELEAWRSKQEPPKRADGKPFGASVIKLSTDASQWKQWFAQHAAGFNPQLRYRSGQPITPTVLLRNLRDPHSHPMLRRCAAAELLVRYGCTEPLEPDMPVTQQLHAMRRIEAWATQHEAGFLAGGWYLNGHLQ